MWERAILPEIEVPAIGILWEPLLTDTGEESIVVILPLTPTYDLAVPLGGDEIVTEDGTRDLWVLLHVEGLRLIRVVIDEERPVMLFADRRLSWPAEVL